MYYLGTLGEDNTQRHSGMVHTQSKRKWYNVITEQSVNPG